MKNLKWYLLSGISLGICFHFSDCSLLVFISVVPIFYAKQLQDSSENKGSTLLTRYFLFAFCLNSIGLTWVFKDDIGIGFLLILFNSILMAIPFALCDLIEKIVKMNRIYAWCFSWISFELLSIHWELNFPWLLLGNLLSNHIQLIQWYEYTGVLGGTVWILYINKLVFDLILGRNRQQGYLLLVILSAPCLISALFWFDKVPESHSLRKMAVVQPNIESHFEKANAPYLFQMSKIIKLIESKQDSFDYLILPETALEPTTVKQLDLSPYLPHIATIVKQNRSLCILAGVGLNTEDGLEHYNSIISYHHGQLKNIYHKIKLVPFSEKIPYATYWKPAIQQALELFFKCGKFSNTSQDLYHVIQSDRLISIVCYEGLFGAYTAQLVNQSKAHAIVLIANEGWWHESYFNQQFLNFAKVRSIENRKWMVKCSNSGISALINPRGVVMDQLDYNKAGVLAATISLNETITFYSKYQDWIGYLALFILFGLSFIKRRKGEIS